MDLQQSLQDRKVGRYLLDSWVAGRRLIGAATVDTSGNLESKRKESIRREPFTLFILTFWKSIDICHTYLKI